MFGFHRHTPEKTGTTEAELNQTEQSAADGRLRKGQSMKIAIGNDHAAVQMKQEIRLKEAG